MLGKVIASPYYSNTIFRLLLIGFSIIVFSFTKHCILGTFCEVLA